jgi:hypothetical protein
MRPFSAMSRMWRSRWFRASAPSVLATADARGGMTTSGGRSGRRHVAACTYTRSAD